MVACDLVARILVSNSELPVGAVTALIGAPFLPTYILKTERSDKMIEVKNVSAGYSGIDVIENISLKLEVGLNLSIVGPNGCGKSTLLKAIAGIIPIKGDVLIDGKSIKTMKRAEIAKK